MRSPGRLNFRPVAADHRNMLVRTPERRARPAELAMARAICRRRSVILAGHGVCSMDPGNDQENLCVRPETFRAQLELLLEAGFTFVTVAEIARQRAEGRWLPGFAALTFDDGMHDNLTVLAPILREYDLPATVYVTTGFLGQPNPWLAPSTGARMMTGAEVCELRSLGVEIGAHTVTHPDLSTLDREECYREVRGSRDALEELLGEPVRSFAYPYSRYGPAALAAVRDAGFETAVTGDGLGGGGPLELGREIITGRDGASRFLVKLAGVYDPIYNSALSASLLSATRSHRARIRAILEARRVSDHRA